MLLEHIRHGKIIDADIGKITYDMDQCIYGVYVLKSPERHLRPEDLVLPLLDEWFSVYLRHLKDGDGLEVLISILNNKNNFPDLGELV